MINNIISPFLYIKFISSPSIVPAVLGRPDFIIIRTKVSQDLTFIWWIPGAMDVKSVFGYIFRMIYIPFYDLARALTYPRVSIWRGESSSHYPDVTSTVGIFPSRFFLRRLYYIFINIFCYLYALKHVNVCLKSNVLIIKSLHTCLINPAIGYTV